MTRVSMYMYNIFCDLVKAFFHLQLDFELLSTSLDEIFDTKNLLHTFLFLMLFSINKIIAPNTKVLIPQLGSIIFLASLKVQIHVEMIVKSEHYHFCIYFLYAHTKFLCSFFFMPFCVIISMVQVSSILIFLESIFYGFSKVLIYSQTKWDDFIGGRRLPSFYLNRVENQQYAINKYFIHHITW